MFIGDPSYFPSSMVKPTGQVVRSICLLNHSVFCIGTAGSAQIIIPGSQVGRVNDIYVSVMDKSLEVVQSGVTLVIVSTKVEGHENPVAELAPGFALLGSIMQRFDSVR